MEEIDCSSVLKTYAYGAIRAENQDLLSTISELKTRLEKVEKGKSVNTKFDKTNGFQSLLCVTPLNKHAFQKKTDVSKTEENHVVSKPVTLQTSSNKQTGANQNKNVIKPGMYRVVTTQESQINKTKSGLSSTGVNATSRVRRPMSKDSSVMNSVLVNSKKAAKNVSVYVRKNKQKDNTSANVISNKENVIAVDVANASKAKTLLCVSCSSDRSQSQAMAIIYMAISLFVMYEINEEGLRHNSLEALTICDGDLEVAFFVPIHVTYEIWKEMICSQEDAILIFILSPFLTWLLRHPFVSCTKQLQQSHGYGTKDCHILIFGTIERSYKTLDLVEGLTSLNMEEITFVLCL
ncbi:hypothetical protein Tco_0529869 [Tanacetum coccineum]